jgi:poly(ADP-ribose) glycohydrolase
MSEEEKLIFYKETLPFVSNLVLKTSELFKNELPILIQSKEKTISLTREQCACILGNSFFCTFARESDVSSWEKSKFCSINFDELFNIPKNVKQKIAKIEMILNYFKRISKNSLNLECSNIVPIGEVEFARKCLFSLPQFSDSKKCLNSVKFESSSKIEDEMDSLIVFFSSSFVGGNCLSHGFTQEDILHFIFPETICSRLFTQRLLNGEVLKLKGAERFSIYEKSKDSLEFKGDYIDKNVDEKGSIINEIVEMDPMILFGKEKTQWKKAKIDRELYKSYLAFSTNKLKNISTGNWGVSMKGNPELKAIIQFITATQTEQQLIYHTRNNKLTEKLSNLIKILTERSVSVGSIYNEIMELSKEIDTLDDKDFSIVDHLKQKFEK